MFQVIFIASLFFSAFTSVKSTGITPGKQGFPHINAANSGLSIKGFLLACAMAVVPDVITAWL